MDDDDDELDPALGGGGDGRCETVIGVVAFVLANAFPSGVSG